MILYAVVNEYVMDIDVSKLSAFESGLFEYVDAHYRDLGKQILEKKELTDDISSQLTKAINEYKKIFLAEEQ
jgi:F-type H+-transporting ATPase subunit alpha